MVDRERQSIRLTIIEPRPGMSVIGQQPGFPPGAPAIRGRGNIDLLCGNCGYVVVERAFSLSLMNAAVSCPECHKVNVGPEFER